jgi:hypothetical protein
MSFFVAYEIEDLVKKEKYQGHEVVIIEFQGKADQILAIDRIFSTENKRNELFPEIEFNFDLQIEWVHDNNQQLIYQ